MWNERNRERLEVALNEADVLGVRALDDDAGSVAFLLHVTALPEVGPMDQDPRRMLNLHDVTRLRVLLRPVSADGNGSPIPLADLNAVDEFFESLTIGGSMYGWRFFDEPDLSQDWPSEPSLVMSMTDHSALSTFYWFNECARIEDGEIRSYCIEGTADFGDISVRRADGTDQATENFVEEGVRWWQALQDRDPRVSLDAQRAWSAARLSWRDWPGLPAG